VPFAVLFAVNFALLLAWTLKDPLRFERVKVDDNNPFSDTYGTCKFENDGTVGFAVAILVVNFSSILLACAEAYRAREIGDEFSESKWVAVTIASWFQVFVVGMPVMFLVTEFPTATYFLKTSIIFVACMSLLLFIFVPKVMIQRKNVVIKGSMVMRNSNKRAFSKSMQQSQQGSTPFSSEATAATPQSNTASDGSSLGFGVRIVRSPALSTVQTEMEDNLKDRIRELEERVLKLEKENAELKGVEQDGSVVPEPPQRSRNYRKRKLSLRPESIWESTAK